MDRKIVTVALLTVTTCAALSGFYYDNGVDQTVVHKQLTKRERKEMQSEILHLLGLQHRPHPSFALEHRKAQEAEKVMSNSAPRFLIDVYQSLTEEDSGDLKLKPDLIEREFNVSDKDVNSMDEADVIMSFINRGQHLHGIRHHHSDGRFWFDLSEVPNLTTVIAAELRLFINQSMKIEEEAQLMHVDSEFEEDEDSLMHQMKANNPEDYALTLYEIGSEDSLTYVDRVEVDSNQEGWVAFNVTMALRNWLDKPEENFGLQLVCRHAATGRQISAREVGMVGSHGNQKLQPFMVAFFRSQSRPTSSAAAASVTAEASQSDSGLQLEIEDDEEDEEIPRSIGRFRRQAGNNRKRSKEPEESGPWNPYADFNAHYARRSCQKKNLYVSFRDLGWQDWIIAPDGYAAFYCNGECSFPLNAHMNASNHAIVQTLVHLMNPYRVPKPCCAPIKLSSISVLYFDDNSNVILKKYRNMVVKSCGCH